MADPANFSWVLNTVNYGSRPIGSQAYQIQNQASTLANSAIDAVDGVLDALQGTVSSGLSEVFSAINALGQFKPGSIAFSYTIPDYVQSAFALPTELSLDNAPTAPTAPSTGTFSFPISSETPPSISATAPTAPPIAAITPPTLQSAGGEPTPVSDAEIEVPSAPSADLPGALTLSEPTAPALKTLEAPDMTLPELPTYKVPEVEEPPNLPELKPTYFPMKYANKRSFQAGVTVPQWMSIVRALPVDFSTRLHERDDFSARTTWSSRGFTLDDDAQQAQITYRGDMSRLMAGGEARRSEIDAFITLRSAIVFELDAVMKEWRQTFELDYLGPLKIAFDVDKLYVGAYYDLFKALTALYNARVATFNTEVAVYRNAVEAAMATVEKWKAEVEAEISKTKLNSQLAATYAASVQARTAKASLYEANVQALFANVQAYRSRMEAFATQAEVARVKLATYKGKVDAYIGGLTSYKAQFDVYEAQIRGVAAQNQVAEAQTKISMADMQAAGADAAAKEIGLQIESEKLKLEARQNGADYENQRLKNSLEAIIAQVEGDVGRAKILEWGANVQLKDVENDAIATEAQAAARYYNAASDSAYRATEQAFRAMMSAAQASNIAQEAASRSAASVAQGAYSAMHVNATLQGSGRVSGSEDNDGRLNEVINDWLVTSKSKEQILSA